MATLQARLVVGRRILREEGIGPLLSRGTTYLVRRAVVVGRYYVLEHALVARNEAEFRPRAPGLDVRVLSSNREADALPPSWDPRPIFLTGASRLEVGATAFCLYIGGELAHVGWTAVTPAAKKLMDSVPYRVDFERGEACTGGTWTRPNFRGLGLMTYSYFLRLEHLRALGYVRSRNCVAVDNAASLRAHAKFKPKMCSVGLMVRVPGWTYWSERPITKPA